MSEPGRPGPPRTPTELFDCDRVSAYLESYLLGQVPPPERRGMRLHIHRCPECFAQVTERDPLQLFAPLADQERPAAGWDGFWEGVRDGIERDSLRRAPFRIPLRWVPAAVAALLVLAVALGLTVPRLLRDDAGQVVADRARRTEPGLPYGLSSVPDSGLPTPETVEQVLTPDARDVQVYSMRYLNAGPSGPPPGPVTELVLIVDAGLEL